MTEEQDSEKICRLLQKSGGVLIGRFGTIEMEVWGKPTDKKLHSILEKNAGIFPQDNIQNWILDYEKAAKEADSLAIGWYRPTSGLEQFLLKKINWSGEKTCLRALEPYYVTEKNRWTKLLENKKVCIVSSFTQSIQTQIQKGETKIWKNLKGSIWPSGVKWSFIQTGYSPITSQGRGSWSDITGKEILSWKDAVNSVVEDVCKTESEYVIIGCGGLGMCIGAELKRRGKKCIVMGGAIQILFGVKGRRWENHSVISYFCTEDWIWPSREETPGAADLIEHGCYWG